MSTPTTSVRMVAGRSSGLDGTGSSGVTGAEVAGSGTAGSDAAGSGTAGSEAAGSGTAGPVGGVSGGGSSTVTVTRGAGAADGSKEPRPTRNPMRNPTTPVSPATSMMIVGLLDALGYSGGGRYITRTASHPDQDRKSTRLHS